MRLRHFAVEQKRSVSIEALLQFQQSLIRSIPFALLVHHQNDFIRFRIVRHDVNDGGGIFDVCSLRFDLQLFNS